MVRKKNFHGLKKIKVRQSWNKYNLYNLSRLQQPYTVSRTFFQQKWTAKAETRAYHGEQIRERQWTRMFNRYIPAVVPMDAKELAEDDGSAHGAGRGSGKDVPPLAMGERSKPQPLVTPYMSMTFYPTERRLDTAIFRALFASSTRQARQFCVHGFVKVNGKKMKYPGYLLNPGDMFSVDPDMVMFATGGKKGASQGEAAVSEADPDTETVDARPAEDDTIFDEAWEDDEEEFVVDENQVEQDEGNDTDVEETEAAEKGEEDLDSVPPATLKARSKELKALREEIVQVATKSKDLNNKRKQELRALYKSIRTQNFQKITRDALNKHKFQFQAIKDLIANPITGFAKAEAPLETSEAEPEDPLLQEQLREMRKNPHLAALKAWPNSVDKTKPYCTPWRPREFMSAFAFIPRYLEVNQNVCSAVYLRDPVARPGAAEVPSPFHPETNLLAFQWYLRRR